MLQVLYKCALLPPPPPGTPSTSLQHQRQRHNQPYVRITNSPLLCRTPLFPPLPRCFQKPDILSRFIPPDPWVGRVSLSSPQALAAASSGVTANGPTTASPGSGSCGGGGADQKRPHGIVGLRNEGNWCYLNASLQALARCAPFRAHLVECASTPDVAGRPW